MRKDLFSIPLLHLSDTHNGQGQGQSYWPGTQPKSPAVWVDRDPVTWLIIAASQDLHWQEAAVRICSGELVPATLIWDLDVSIAVLNTLFSNLTV